jgi:hypothetical protein
MSTGKLLPARRRSFLPPSSGCSRLGLPWRRKGSCFLWDVVNWLYQSSRRYIPEYRNRRMVTMSPHACLISSKLLNMEVVCAQFRPRVRIALILQWTFLVERVRQRRHGKESVILTDIVCFWSSWFCYSVLCVMVPLSAANCGVKYTCDRQVI